jgi:hypothetical protein
MRINFSFRIEECREDSGLKKPLLITLSAGMIGRRREFPAFSADGSDHSVHIYLGKPGRKYYKI